jgi:hypothetical protein
MTRARYAVFLPVRNGAAFVREAIDSVIAQTRGDWVLVVLDNASSDGTADIAEGYAHPSIQVHRSSSSLQVWESWHRVWSMLSKREVDVEFATIIGHDDRLLPDFLEAINKLAIAHPRASLYQTAFDMIDENGRMIRPSRPIPEIESAADFVAARLWGLRDSVGTGYVFRPADYVAVGGIPNLPFLLCADDLVFARLAQLRFKASCAVSQCVYRLHRGSLSHGISAARLVAQVSAIEQYVESLHGEFPELMSNSAGRSALACFLAREVMLLLPLAKEVLLPGETCRRLRRLAEAYCEVAPDMNYRQWLGTNFVSRAVYPLAKQTMLVSVLLAERITGSHKVRQ